MAPYASPLLGPFFFFTVEARLIPSGPQTHEGVFLQFLRYFDNFGRPILVSNKLFGLFLASLLRK